MGPLTDSPRCFVIFGAGAFGARLACALAHDVPEPTEVHVVARNPDAVRSACLVAASHAAAGEQPARFVPHGLDPADGPAVRALLRSTRPDAVAICVSHQGPAELGDTRTAWGQLIADAGFGVTLPLQADLAMKIARACAAEPVRPTVVNACFPDAVNVLMRAAGLPVLCGVGNASTLATALCAALGLGSQGRLKLLAHHAHLHPPLQPGDEALAWVDDKPSAEVGQSLGPFRALAPALRNDIGAWAAADVLRAAVRADRPWHGHVPGPYGMPGGYPVTITDHRLVFRLPPGTSLQTAIEWNQRIALLDGVTVGAGGAVLSAGSVEALRRHWPGAPSEFGPGDIEEVCHDLLGLRERLRCVAATVAVS